MNIALDDIRSKAPEGATHIDVFGDYWQKVGPSWYCMFRSCSAWNEYPYYLPLPKLKPL